jgi:hypothetical protein
VNAKQFTLQIEIRIFKKVLYIHLKKNQPDAQFVFSILRQTPIRVSGVSTAHHQEVHHMDTIVGMYCSFYMTVCCPGWVGNILKINCASSWPFLNEYIKMHGQQNIKFIPAFVKSAVGIMVSSYLQNTLVKNNAVL